MSTSLSAFSRRWKRCAWLFGRSQEEEEEKEEEEEEEETSK